VFTDTELSQLTELLRPRVVSLVDDLSNKTQEVQRLEREVRLLKEMLRLERRQRYGPGSERLSDAQLILLDAEPGVHAQEVTAEGGLLAVEKDVVPAGPRGRRGERSLPAHLPTEEVILCCAPPAALCPCCQQPRVRIGFRETRRLHRCPPRYSVRTYRQEKLACPRCPQGGVATAPQPDFILEKGIASNELLVDAILAKYELHLPMYRQQVQIERECGAIITRSDLCHWAMECGFLLLGVSREMMRTLLGGNYLQVDETPVGVQSREVIGRNHRGWLWQYSRPGGPVVFDYRDSRGREGPESMLKNYRGVLQTDGYAVYDLLQWPGLVHGACLAHVRRKFKAAHDLHPQESGLLEILRSIRTLYRIESQARDDLLDPAQRLALRKQQSRPIFDALKQQILALRAQVLPQSLSGKACDYALAQWSKLETYLEHGEVEIDTNLAEGAMRPVALGRKNWLHFGSKEAGPRIAAILSITETCHRLKVPVRAYLLEVLPKLAGRTPMDVAALTPEAWAATRAAHA
jgi:transposase